MKFKNFLLFGIVFFFMINGISAEITLNDTYSSSPSGYTFVGTACQITGGNMDCTETLTSDYAYKGVAIDWTNEVNISFEFTKKVLESSGIVFFGLQDTFSDWTNSDKFIGLYSYGGATGSSCGSNVDVDYVYYKDSATAVSNYTCSIATNTKYYFNIYYNPDTNFLNMNIKDSANTILTQINKELTFNISLLDTINIALRNTGSESDRFLYDNLLIYVNKKSNATITAKDIYSNNSINNFSIFFNNVSYFTNTGLITLPIFVSDSDVHNLTFFNMSNYFNRTYTNYNFSLSGNLEGELYPEFSFKNITFENYIEYNSSNYTRNLSITINMFSFTEDNPRLEIYENGTLKENKTITGNGSISFTTYFQSTTEGLKNLSFNIYNDYDNVTENQEFIFDLNNPTSQIYFNVATGFTIAVNVSGVCTDTIFSNLRYNLSFNNNILFLGNRTSGTNQTNETTLATGTNTGKLICYDPFGSNTEMKEVQAYAKTLILINELNGSLFDVNNVSGVKVYYSNSSFFDFKTMNTSEVNFTSIDDSKLRFEIEYEDGTIITRYIDTLLINGTDLRVCANPTGTTHYENLIGSSSAKKVLLLNLFSQCYVGADETSFAYQDGLVLKVFTIASKYNLYYYDSTNTLKLLALLDGSISIFHNIDVLEFKLKGYEFSIISDGLTFEKYKINGTVVEDIMLIRYDNIKENNAEANLRITNLDDNTVVYNINLTDPNSQTILWNYSTINITNTTLFKIQIFKTLTTGIEETTTRYFNTKINTGILKNELVYVLTILFIFFLLTLVSVNIVFGWFGILTLFINIVLISLAVGGGLMNFWLMLHIIILIYLILYLKDVTFPTVS